MTYATQYPEQVDGMVLLDPSDPYRSTADHASADAGAPGGDRAVAEPVPAGPRAPGPVRRLVHLPEPAAGQIRAY